MTKDRRPGPAGTDAAGVAADRSDRLRDHASIRQIADELVPSLVAKLEATGLGELEVREGDWRVRLRSPGRTETGPRPPARRASDRAGRQPGHQERHGPGALDLGVRPSTNGTQPGLAPVGPGRDTGGRGAGGRGSTDGGDRRVIATSPAVGVFQPSKEVARGARVRAGDRIGSVDVLGVAADVLAPADAMIGAALVEPGQAVEYGQPLFELDRVGPDTGVDVAGGGAEG